MMVKEDNHMNDDQDQEAGESGTKNFADDTTTSTAGEGEAGTEDILHGHEGVVEAGDNPDNQVVSTRLISGLSVPIDGTTLYHEGVYQPKSSSQEGQFVYDDDVMRTAGGYATGTSDMGEECCVVVQLYTPKHLVGQHWWMMRYLTCPLTDYLHQSHLLRRNSISRIRELVIVGSWWKRYQGLLTQVINDV